MKAAILKCSQIKEFLFECSRCGHCCSTPGYICLTNADIEAISSHLKLSTEDFKNKYTKLISKFYRVFQGSSESPCIFLEGNRCSIYHARPEQCRSFPFWHENMSSRKAWNEKTKNCKAAKKIIRKTKRGNFTLLCVEGNPFITYFKDK